MIDKILQISQEQVATGKRVALITITHTNGSSPASIGQMMAVLEDGTTVGTVGGGSTEHLVTQKALEALKNSEKVFVFDYNHSDSGMVCGGEMMGFGAILGQENHLYIFGGGHISQSLAPLARTTGFSVTVIEDRPEFADNFHDVNYIVAEPSEYKEKIVFSGTPYVVICTRGHKSDDTALHFVMGKNIPYIGMIGSQKKVQAIFSDMENDGYSAEDMAKICAPIGLNIASAIPAEIAVSILAEILMKKNNGTAAHKKMM